MSPRILFVDDNLKVLKQLGRLVRTRAGWDAVFVSDGPTALNQLSLARFDVVVSDLAMPQMDGVALLSQVRARWPYVSRVLLSGPTTIEQGLRAAGVAHRFLSKPPVIELLADAVMRPIVRADLVPDAETRVAASALASLPSSPSVHTALNATLADASGMGRIARLAARDLALSAKLLQVASGSFFGTARRVTSVEQAVASLQAGAVQGLLRSPELFHVGDLDLERLHERSLYAATLASRIVPSELSQDAFLASWLGEIGRVVAPGESSPKAGAYLLGLWGLPEEIVSAVAFHRDPWSSPPESRLLVAATHVAHALAGEGASLDAAFVAEAGIAGDVASWRAAARGDTLPELRAYAQ